MVGADSNFTAADERRHPFDPDDWSWNESYLLSWIDLQGGPAGLFRVGVLPNQERAMVWCFVHTDDGWLGIDESRLPLVHLDTSTGVAYDQWGLRFAWEPDPPLEGGRFRFAGSFLRRSGPSAGAYVEAAVELDCTATSGCFGTVTGQATDTAFEQRRFEQSLHATGTVTVDGQPLTVDAGAHRDRSWGPREWRMRFFLGDVQAAGRQLWFAGGPAAGGGYIRDQDGDAVPLQWSDSTIDVDDATQTITAGSLTFRAEAGEELVVEIEPAAASVAFDMAHTPRRPETWSYWRTLVSVRVPGWGEPCRGWYEANRYPR